MSNFDRDMLVTEEPDSDRTMPRHDWLRKSRLEVSGSEVGRNRYYFLGAMGLAFIFAVVALGLIVTSSVFLSRTNQFNGQTQLNDLLLTENTELQRELFASQQDVSDLVNKTEWLNQEIYSLNVKMRETRHNILSLFQTSFIHYGNKSFVYATLRFEEIVNWNFGDYLCKSLSSEMIVPDSYSTFHDLIQACPTAQSNQTCWVGVSREQDGKTWLTTTGTPVTINSDYFGMGQPVTTKGYDCLYLRDGLLYNMQCEGNGFKNSSTTVISSNIVCQGSA